MTDSTEILHQVRVAELKGFQNNYRWRATCSCGWWGSGWTRKENADRDAEWHVDKNRVKVDALATYNRLRREDP
jgi:hypothetical protein